jgi:hypothetical protein
VVSSDATSQDPVAESFQQQVDDLANGLLSRGIRPNPEMIKAQVFAPHHRLVAALDNWARRLGQANATGSVTTGLVADFPRQRRGNAISRAVQASGEVAAKQRASAQRIARQNELAAEIYRAQSRLEKLELRYQRGEGTPAIDLELEKVRMRLRKMRAALISADCVPSDEPFTTEGEVG